MKWPDLRHLDGYLPPKLEKAYRRQYLKSDTRVAALSMLLVAVAGRLSALLRKSDTVARMGGDEFAVLLTDITQVEEPSKSRRRYLKPSVSPSRLTAEI